MSLSALLLLALVSFSIQAPLTKRALSNGPVIASNFPDPAFIEVSGRFYAFSTTNGKYNVPIATSPDFAAWTIADQDALPRLPSWAIGSVWAPDVVQLKNGAFVLYFAAATTADPSRHCVGAATAPTPAGPYTPVNFPLACPLAQGGAIDPAGFIDPASGSQYIVYKIDGNSLGGGGMCGNGNGAYATPIMLQRVDPDDGVTPIGEPVKILDRGVADGPIIEAPSLTWFRGVYVLFFSSNCYNGGLYDVSYATAKEVGGPYVKAGKPLLVSGQDGGRLNSPGGADVDVGGERLVFHSDSLPANPGIRQMWTAGLTITGTEVSVDGPVVQTGGIS